MLDKTRESKIAPGDRERVEFICSSVLYFVSRLLFQAISCVSSKISAWILRLGHVSWIVTSEFSVDPSDGN